MRGPDGPLGNAAPFVRPGLAARAACVVSGDTTPRYKPAPDSLRLPGSTLILKRGEPTSIWVINRTSRPTQVHWHGLELESYSDGVAGWSGAGRRLAPVIAAGDSFIARLSQPRAGTFIYHTHLNDLEQITSGLYGPLAVLEPGERFDPRVDHVFTQGWDGEAEPPQLLVNGDSTPTPRVLARGVGHRFRFVNIGPAAQLQATLRRDTTLMEWRAVAKDGADLPGSQARLQPARVRLAVGETADFVLIAEQPGPLVLTFLTPKRQRPIVQRFEVR